MSLEPTEDSGPRLSVVMYHYVRDLPQTRFPRIKGLLLDDFREQVDALCERYEMATLQSAIEFLKGGYRPQRDLCLLTFDDGLKEHFTDVTPTLASKGVEGLFFVVTGCLEEGRVASVHKNHFLMASLDFDHYQGMFLETLASLSPDTNTQVSDAEALPNYRWDTPEVARFKYLLNFRIQPSVRERVLDALFVDHFGDEREFARELYVTWDEAREMQSSGMVIGGHSHQHQALATLSDNDQETDLKISTDLLRQRLKSQSLWPFSYPYGKPIASFTATTSSILRELDYGCSFSTEVGDNGPGQDPFAIRRIDTKDFVVPVIQQTEEAGK